MAAVGSSFGHHCQKYAERDRRNKKIFPRRPLHTRKINQRVNLNITNWTYESENPCFLSERFTPEWIDESSNCRASRAECITRKNLPDWTELFPGCKKRITWDQVVYNGRKSQSFHLGAEWNFIGRILISRIVRIRFCLFVCKDRL